jgi:hypothetical protein
MEFNGVLVLAAVWFLLNLISNARRKPQRPPRGPREPLRPKPLPPSPDATQREGHRLELVLRELQRSLEEAAGVERPPAIERPTALSLPPAEEVEERTSLEIEPEIKSLEEPVNRQVRQRVDRDEETADIEAERIRAAAQRDLPRTKADHAAFDQRIRQEPADHTATKAYTRQQLRDAMVWREILGPPVALRGGEVGKGGSGEV